MIRRLEHVTGTWIEYKELLDNYMWRDQLSYPTWYPGARDTMNTSIIEQLLNPNWKEVTASIDPNDLQTTCDHRKWNAATDSCAICGKDWNTILWTPNGNKPCCGGNSGAGPYFYSGGAWHAIDCDSLKPPQSQSYGGQAQIDYRPKSNGHRCECGGWATANPNAHAHYCPEYKK